MASADGPNQGPYIVLVVNINMLTFDMQDKILKISSPVDTLIISTAGPILLLLLKNKYVDIQT